MVSYADYLAHERVAEVRHEYVNVVSMPWPEARQSTLVWLPPRAFIDALRGKPCAPYTSDLRVKIMETGRATYPDVTVVCGELERAPDDNDAVTNPNLIVEVLSDSTERSDRGEKWAHYQRLVLLQTYMLVSQNARRIEVFARELGRWLYRVYGEEDVVELPSLGITIPVSTIY